MTTDPLPSLAEIEQRLRLTPNDASACHSHDHEAMRDALRLLAAVRPLLEAALGAHDSTPSWVWSMDQAAAARAPLAPLPEGMTGRSDIPTQPINKENK